MIVNNLWKSIWKEASTAKFKVPLCNQFQGANLSGKAVLQEILHIFSNRNVHYFIQMDPDLNQVNPVYIRIP
jgi:hypothetical protein